MILGNVYKNRKKICYIASFDRTEEDENGNEINYYKKPEPYKFNVQPANGSTDIALYGERVSKMYKAIISLKTYNNKFKEGDVAYLENTIPKGETEHTYGISANYKIVSVRPQNTVIAMYFERIKQ